MRLLALIVVVSACKGNEPPRPAVKAPITDTEARTYATELAAAALPCDATEMSARFGDKPAAGRAFCEWLAGVAEYKLVNLRSVSGAPHPIMRRLLANDDSGAMFVNYDELALDRSANGTVRLADVFSYRQGVWISDGDLLGSAAAHHEVQAARDLLRSGDRAAALKAIDALPAAMRAERGVQMLRVRAAQGVSPEAYKAALDELAATPDAGIALTELDGALDRGDGAAAIHWIDLLEKTIGIDAYLEAQRVVALVRMGDLDRALTTINAAVELEPTLTRALEIKLDVLIAKKMWPEALATLQDLETNHGVDFDLAKLRAEPRLTELVDLPAFKEWAATRTPPPAP